MAVLFVGLESPGGGVIVTVLTRLPENVGETVPVTEKVHGDDMLSIPFTEMLPDPDEGLGHVAMGKHVHVIEVNPVGIVSFSDVMTGVVLEVVTRISYVICPPGAGIALVRVFVTPTSTGFGLMMIPG